MSTHVTERKMFMHLVPAEICTLKEVSLVQFMRDYSLYLHIQEMPAPADYTPAQDEPITDAVTTFRAEFRRGSLADPTYASANPEVIEVRVVDPGQANIANIVGVGSSPVWAVVCLLKRAAGRTLLMWNKPPRDPFDQSDVKPPPWKKLCTNIPHLYIPSKEQE